jgi:hypothetical protein
LRSLLTTFNPEEQARFTALSGISIEDSLIPTSHEEEELLVKDAKKLASFHYLLASNWSYKQATKMKLGWYEIAHVNPAIICTYKKVRIIGGKVEYFATYNITFAQILENLKTPDKEGIRYLVPEFLPSRFFLSDDLELMEKQLRGRRCLIDP